MNVLSGAVCFSAKIMKGRSHEMSIGLAYRCRPDIIIIRKLSKFVLKICVRRNIMLSSIMPQIGYQDVQLQRGNKIKKRSSVDSGVLLPED